MDIKETIKKAAYEEGADLLGFADHEGKTAVVLAYYSAGDLDLGSLDRKAERIASRVRRAGFKAEVISACDGGGVSLRRLAEKAGLGFIGKSGLLITERFGPHVRLAGLQINTELPVQEGAGPAKGGCNGCMLCVKACPAGAIERRDASRCRDFVEGMGEGRCTACIDVCPFKVKG